MDKGEASPQLRAEYWQTHLPEVRPEEIQFRAHIL